MTPDSFRSLCTSRGLRCTRQRHAVYAALCASKSHPTADELFRAVRADLPGVSLATIYNTLETFTLAGLCRRLPSAPSGPQGNRYDADTFEHAHVMTADGRILDLPEDLSRRLIALIPDDLIAQVRLLAGVQSTRISLQFLEDRADHPPHHE